MTKWKIEFTVGLLAVSQVVDKADYFSPLHALNKLMEKFKVDEEKLVRVLITEVE